MTKLVWDNKTEGLYDSGVSKGVFFGSDGVGHAWAGLISVAEKPQANEPTAIYNSLGEKYDIHGNKAEKKHGLSCYTYPDVMESYLGFEILDDYGYRVDERNPKKFSMAYRVELGNGLYEIHVLLNQIATLGELTRQTQSASVGLSTVTMTLEGVPDPKFKTSHVILDSRLPITKSAEKLLFGSDYTDSNINDFLTAEPVWETVATNYAPIIEPDYDNYVWLGRENLFSVNNYSYHTNAGYTEGRYTSAVISITPGETYTISIPNKQTNRLGIYQVNLPNGINAAYTDKLILSSGDVPVTIPGRDYIETVTTDLTGGVYIVLYLSNEGGYEHQDAIKVEKGSISTPWIPAKVDPSQEPHPSNPYPSNYKPAAKKVSLAHNIPTANAILYYDELTSGLGVYSKTDGTFNSYRILYMPYVANGTSVRLNHLVSVYNVSGPTNSNLGRLGLGRPTVYSPLPQYPGTYESGLSEYTFDLSLFPTAHMIFQNGGASGAAEVSYSKVFLTLSGYEGEFFDANSTPPNKGTKYVRVETSTHDYTLKQELRLRSTSKVRVYDQTSYDYWLEAADTMLLLQNEIFTFSGPQAVITDDTFTIDDSIVGFTDGSSE